MIRLALLCLWVVAIAWLVTDERSGKSSTTPVVVPQVPEVFAAPDGWFFYAPSIAPLDGSEPPPAAPPAVTREQFEWLGRELRQRGIPAAAMLLPAKWRVYEDKLGDREVEATRRALYGRARHLLTEAGFETPDMLRILLDERARHPDRLLYHPTDSHMSHGGFELACRWFVTEVLRVDGATVDARLAAWPPSPPRRLLGDLFDFFGLRDDPVMRRRFGTDERTRPLPPCHDAPGADCFLIGDSFATHHGGYLPRLVQAMLGARVDARLIGPAYRTSAAEIVESYVRRPPRHVLVITNDRLFSRL